MKSLKGVTPEQKIEDILWDSLAIKIEEKQILKGGLANEAYLIKPTDSAEDLIIRISRRQESRKQFPAEKWAFERCAENGIRVPKVLYVGATTNVGEDNSLENLFYSIETKLPGVPLEKFMSQHSDRKETVSKLIREAGHILSTMHKIKIDGFGRLDAEGKAPADRPVWLEMTDWFNKTRMLEIAEQISFDPEVISRAFSLLLIEPADLPAKDPLLLHNDYSPGNIMVSEDGTAVTGIFDGERVIGGDPISELAYWKFRDFESDTLSSLMEGYGEEALDSSENQRRMNLWSISIALQKLEFYATYMSEEARNVCAQKLMEAVGNYDA